MLNVYTKEPEQQAQVCLIWMHGLGADASDMAGLSEQLLLEGTAIRHVFLDAPVRPVTINNKMPMPAWYDILDLKFIANEDREGILAAEAQIHQVIDTQIEQGIPPARIFLAGFSQGGAMALRTALHREKVAGVICLSGYLPLAAECRPALVKTAPMFIAYGRHDPLVLPAWSKLTVDWLAAAGYSNVLWKGYPMEHAVCAEEINDLSQWLGTQIKGEA
ncbi:alpha/beta hydrolase [Legionella sp. W10-070]|uniref:alpha/beta hydrolase n=1 Tax=unclassified Legionella TaxID=2622702 RepID=UPI00241516C7|nr:carboxylesterase [Legionella sp. W10-070]MDI9818733.1 carboxylesterase [Legionella sp. PL877]